MALAGGRVLGDIPVVDDSARDCAAEADGRLDGLPTSTGLDMLAVEVDETEFVTGELGVFSGCTIPEEPAEDTETVPGCTTPLGNKASFCLSTVIAKW